MITKEQFALIGVFNKLPYTTVRFFTRRIARGKMPYITNSKTLVYEELEKFAKKAKILRRGEKFPTAKVKGSTIKSVTPEVIKDAIPFDAEDMVNRTPGQAIYVAGKKIDNSTYEQDRRLSSIKLSIAVTSEEIATGVFLNGKYKSPDTGNTVTYSGFPTGTSVAASTIKDWGIWLSQMMNAFVKENKVRVDDVLVGEDVFYAIINSYNSNENNVNKITPSKKLTEDGDHEICINIFGVDVTMIPPATDTDGTTVDTKNWVMMYSNFAYLPAFAGVKNVVKGISSLEAIDVLIRETMADEETGEAKTLGESGYCPLVTTTSLVKKYKVTGL